MNTNRRIQEKYFPNTLFGVPSPKPADPSAVTSTIHAIFDALLNGTVTSSALLSFAMPQMQAFRLAHPKLFNRVVVPLALISVAPGLLSKVPSVWDYFCNYLLASVNIPADEDMVLDVFRTWLKEKGSSSLPNRSSTAFATHKGPSFHGNSVFQTFTHKGRVFMVTVAADKSTTIWTFGVRPKPIEELLDHIAKENMKRAPPRVKIYSTQGGQWRFQAQKLNRQLDSVYLPKADKDRIVNDLEVHLRKDTREWFAQAGIPYKRGYLFHGEPGCGLLLLEDIDAAGLNREVNGEVQAAPDKEDNGNGKAATATKTPSAKTKISLSFVLNALNGTSSPEGHILIMTTNHIKALDSALIRPGRIDYRLEFRLATEEQIREIFTKMYRNAPGVGVVLDAEKLEALTNDFAKRVPEDTFTPAELQGYIMIHRFDPQVAVDEAGAWVEEQVKAKKAKKERKEKEPAVEPVSSPDAPTFRQLRGASEFRGSAGPSAFRQPPNAPGFRPSHGGYTPTYNVGDLLPSLPERVHRAYQAGLQSSGGPSFSHEPVPNSFSGGYTNFGGMREGEADELEREYEMEHEEEEDEHDEDDEHDHENEHDREDQDDTNPE